MSSTAKRRIKSAAVGTAVAAVGLLVAVTIVRWNELRFLVAFHITVRDVRDNVSQAEALVTPAKEAARQCSSEAGSRVVENRCVAALRQCSTPTEWSESFVAFYVLWDRDSIRPETLTVLNDLASSTTLSPTAREDIRGILERQQSSTRTSAPPGWGPPAP